MDPYKKLTPQELNTFVLKFFEPVKIAQEKTEQQMKAEQVQPDYSYLLQRILLN